MMRIFGERAEPMSASLAEDVLVERAQNGERAAFDELVRRHFARIHGLAFRLVGNHEDAEDLAQECFVRAWGALDRFRDSGGLAAWFARIAIHLAHDLHRRRGRRGEAVAGALGPSVTAPSSPEPSAALSERELSRRIESAIERLPWRLRVALTLRVFEGLDYVEIARTSGVTETTARTHVMKARRLLARWLGPLLEGRS